MAPEVNTTEWSYFDKLPPDLREALRGGGLRLQRQVVLRTVG